MLFFYYCLIFAIANDIFGLLTHSTIYSDPAVALSEREMKPVILTRLLAILTLSERWHNREEIHY